MSKTRAAPQRTAKLFRNGRSQAVRLPADFRFEGKEVYVRRDPATGDVILSQRPEPPSWESFFKLVDEANIPGDFLSDRNQPPLPDRDPFE
jgi:antitoxin VapB